MDPAGIRLLLDDINRILIIKPSALGDIVHSLPFLAAVQKTYPHARIDWVVAHGLHTFLQDHPMIHKLWVIKKDQWKKLGNLAATIREIRALKSGLRHQRYDVSIDLSGLLRSGLITWFANARFRLGFKESDEGSPFFYTHKIHGSMQIHAVDRYLEIAGFMGCKIDEIEYPFAPYNPEPEILDRLPDPYVVMSPSAGKPANRWPADRFGRLAAQLPYKTVVVASKSEADIADKVVKYSKGRAVSIAGLTGLKELMAVIAKAEYMVCNDTGPQHMAAALGIPVFAIFGPANPVRTGPYGPDHNVIQKTYDCVPCYAHKPCKKYRFRCMDTLSVEDVMQTINRRGL